MPDRPTLPPELDDHLDRHDPAERDALERVWALLDRAAPPPTPSPDAAWERLAARLSEAPTPRSPAPDRPALRQARPRRRFAFAALTAVFVAVATTAIWWTRPVVVVSPPGEVVQVALPDGSEATLNGASTLQYARGFARLPFVVDDVRRTALSGEAFFAVEPGARPFVVETFNAEVTVLGTRFNVRSRRGHGESATQVTVTEGRVRVLADGEAVVLAAGEGSAIEDAAPAAPEPVPAELAEAWQSGGFAVRGLPLPAVLAEVERRWGVDITLHDGASEERVTLYLARADGAESVLRDLAAARDLRYRPTSTGYAVYPGGN